jgi:hypothetical protein
MKIIINETQYKKLLIENEKLDSYITLFLEEVKFEENFNISWKRNILEYNRFIDKSGFKYADMADTFEFIHTIISHLDSRYDSIKTSFPCFIFSSP